jgi:hypothetical protein
VGYSCGALLLLGMLCGCAGEPRRLAAAQAPPRLVPSVRLPDTPIAPNHGRVVLDTTSGPMRVTAKYDPSFTPPGGSIEKGLGGELCTTPCVVDLPVGRYRLFFSATANAESSLGDSDDLIVNPGLTVYRRAPGRYQTSSPADQVGPVALFAAGVLAVTIGAALLSAHAASKDGDQAAPAALIVGGSAALIGGGVWSYDRSRATQQDGASTVWQP